MSNTITPTVFYRTLKLAPPSSSNKDALSAKKGTLATWPT
jgi:hypothetical protein